MDKQLLLASASEKGVGIALKQSADDGTFSVQRVQGGETVSVLEYAKGIVEFDDAKLVFDRHAKFLFNEVGYEAKGM